jgi:hypothetical protein
VSDAQPALNDAIRVPCPRTAYFVSVRDGRERSRKSETPVKTVIGAFKVFVRQTCTSKKQCYRKLRWEKRNQWSQLPLKIMTIIASGNKKEPPRQLDPPRL